MNRQLLAPLIVGTISVGSGLWVALQLRIGRCIDNGGRWDPLRRACTLPDDAPREAALPALGDYLIGGAVMLVFGYMLLRMWAAIARRKQLEAMRGVGNG